MRYELNIEMDLKKIREKSYYIYNLDKEIMIRNGRTVKMQIVKETEKAIQVISSYKLDDKIVYGTEDVNEADKFDGWIPKSIYKVITLNNGSKLLAVQAWKGNVSCTPEMILAELRESELNADFLQTALELRLNELEAWLKKHKDPENMNVNKKINSIKEFIY